MGDFSDIGSFIDDSEAGVPGGKEKVVALLAGLDSSWQSTSRTTLGVMMAVMACSKDKVAANRCLSGMLGMLWKMSDVYCGLLGGMVESVEQSEMLALSKEVDAAGQDLAGKVDGLGGAVMMGLLVALPTRWTGHFMKLASADGAMVRLLAEGSVPYLLRQLAEAQKAKSRGLRRMASASFALNSRPMARAEAWAKGAGGVYEAVLAGGFDGGVALAEAIRKVGFPDAMG